MKCPVPRAASSPSKSMRNCLRTRETAPGGRLRSPAKGCRTSGQPSTRKGCKTGIKVVLSECNHRESNKTPSDVFRACTSCLTAASTSALMAASSWFSAEAVANRPPQYLQSLPGIPPPVWLTSLGFYSFGRLLPRSLPLRTALYPRLSTETANLFWQR